MQQNDAKCAEKGRIGHEQSHRHIRPPRRRSLCYGSLGDNNQLQRCRHRATKQDIISKLNGYLNHVLPEFNTVTHINRHFSDFTVLSGDCGQSRCSSR